MFCSIIIPITVRGKTKYSSANCKIAYKLEGTASIVSLIGGRQQCAMDGGGMRDGGDWRVAGKKPASGPVRSQRQESDG